MINITANGAYLGSVQSSNGTFEGTVPVAAGHQRVCAVAVNSNGGEDTLLGCQSLTIAVNPFGSLDIATVSPGAVRVQGWAADPDTTTPIEVHVYVDSVGTALTASVHRGDVAAAYPLYGPHHGFDTTIPTDVGGHNVCAYGINTGPGDTNTKLGCIETSANPFGHIDDVQVTGSVMRVRGWAVDPDTPQPITVRLDINGTTPATTALAHIDRPDVAAAYPGFGSAHGFEITMPTQPHTQLCIKGLNTGPGQDVLIGCDRENKSISVMTLNLDNVTEDYSHLKESVTHIPWRTRIGRIAQMHGTGLVPDVLVLQDVAVFKLWSLPFPSADPGSYEVLFELIDALKRETGDTYRIAYVAANPMVWKWFDPLREGSAIVYNADRLENTTTSGISDRYIQPDTDNPVTGVHLRTSFPCGNPPARSNRYDGWCEQLDGNGVFLSSPLISPYHKSGQWDKGTQAVRFQLINQPGSHVVVANVHAHPRWVGPRTDDPPSTGIDRADPSMQTITHLVTAATGIWGHQAQLYPPIIAGDFNFGLDESRELANPGELLADYDLIGHSNVDNVLIGKSTKFPANQIPTAVSVQLPEADPWNPPPGGNSYGECRNSVANLWSDHCAVLTQVYPAALS